MTSSWRSRPANRSRRDPGPARRRPQHRRADLRGAGRDRGTSSSSNNASTSCSRCSCRWRATCEQCSPCCGSSTRSSSPPALRNVARRRPGMLPRELPPKIRGIIERMGAQASVQMHLAVDAFAATRRHRIGTPRNGRRHGRPAKGAVPAIFEGFLGAEVDESASNGRAARLRGPRLRASRGSRRHDRALGRVHGDRQSFRGERRGVNHPVATRTVRGHFTRRSYIAPPIHASYLNSLSMQPA